VALGITLRVVDLAVHRHRAILRHIGNIGLGIDSLDRERGAGAGKFRDNLIAATAALLIGVVVRDRHDIGGIDPKHHDTLVTAAEILGILQSREVQTIGASNVTAGIHILAVHLDNTPNTVVKLARMNVPVVVADRLIREDIPILVDHEAIGLTKEEKFIPRFGKRVRHAIPKEIEQRGSVKPLGNHLQNLASDEVGKGVALKDNLIVDKSKILIGGEKLLNRRTGVHKSLKVAILLGLECLTNSLEIRMVGGNRQGLTVEKNGNTGVRGDVRDATAKSDGHCKTPVKGVWVCFDPQVYKGTPRLSIVKLVTHPLQSLIMKKNFT